MPATITQKQTGRGAAVNSFALTFGAGVAAGAFLVACYSPWLSGGTPNATPTGGGTWQTTTPPPGSFDWNAYINFCPNAAGGATTVTVNYGTGFYIAGSIAEFANMDGTPLDQQAGNSHTGSTDETPDVGPTGTLAQSDELIVACLAVAGTTTNAGIDAATPGYTNLHVEQDAANYMGHSSDWKTVAATGGQSAAWGTLTPGDGYWSAKIVTFKAAAGGTERHQTRRMIQAGGYF